MPEVTGTAIKRKRMVELLFDRKRPASRVVSVGVQRSSTYDIGQWIDAAVDRAVEIGVRNAAVLSAKR
jgi:hypothetical protein